MWPRIDNDIGYPPLQGLYVLVRISSPCQEIGEVFFCHSPLVYNSQDLFHVMIHTHFFYHTRGKQLEITGCVSLEAFPCEPVEVGEKDTPKKFPEKRIIEKVPSIRHFALSVKSNPSHVLGAEITAYGQQKTQYLAPNVVVEFSARPAERGDVFKVPDTCQTKIGITA